MEGFSWCFKTDGEFLLDVLLGVEVPVVQGVSEPPADSSENETDDSE